MNNIPERLMAQAETRKYGHREVKTIPVAGMNRKEIMALFNCPRATAWKSVKRGYFVVNYCKKTVIPGLLDPEGAYRMAWWLFNKKFRGRVPEWAESDDMVQDGVTRLIELAGHPRIKVPGFAFRVISTAMVGYLRRNRRQEHEDESRIDSQMNRVPESWEYGAVYEGCQHCAPSPNTWHCKHAATEAMCRVIEAKGGIPMDLAA